MPTHTTCLSALRFRVFLNTLRTLRTEHSVLKIVLIALFAIAFWAGLFWAFFDAFRFLRDFPDLRDKLIEYLFYLFFMTLLLMLAISNGIIAFTSLFRARETAFLWTLPVRFEDIFVHKQAETLLFSSWAVVSVGTPLIIAYGITFGVPWHFYVLTAFFFVVFVVLPAQVGGMAALALTAYFPRSRKQAMGTLLAVCVALGALWGFQMFRSATGTALFTELWMKNILDRLSFCHNPLLPSYWMSRGLLALTRNDLPNATFYFLLLLSNALFVSLLAYWLASKTYATGWAVAHLPRARRKLTALSVIDPLVRWTIPFVSREMQLLVIKDVKTLRRDPAQWLQFLVFFGLLAVYILNLRNLNYHIGSPYWKNLVSLLNLTATCLTMSTFTQRFIFPLLSLEGRRFWILGLLPIQRRTILFSKFVFTLGWSLATSEALVLVSDWMLDVGWEIAAVHAVAVAVLCVGLAGISTGLGATFPALKEDNPSKIAAGYGGTLNLMFSLIFIAVVIGLIAAPCHLYFARDLLTLSAFKFWLVFALCAAALLSALATVVPLLIGLRSFRRLEF